MSSLSTPQLSSLDLAHQQSYGQTSPRVDIQTLGILRDFQQSQPSCQWSITHDDYVSIARKIQREQDILPSEFELPSRHALNRYLEGYFTGFYNHLPFLHIPTISVINISLALFLALVAIGAQYRFERQEAQRLYCASKALADYKFGLQHHCFGDFTPLNRQSQGHPPLCSVPESESHGRASQDSQHIELTQTMIILMIFATYNHHSLLHNAFDIANSIINHLHESGILEQEDNLSDRSWEQWVKVERRRRTIMGAFIFLHIHSVAYNIPPKLMRSKLQKVQVPLSENHWRAANATEWEAIRKTNTVSEISFGKDFASYFSTGINSSPGCNISSFGKLALIHAIIQQIPLAWELNLTTLDYDKCDRLDRHCLPVPIAYRLKQALGRWKCN